MRFQSVAAGLIGALLLPLAAHAADLDDRGDYGRHAESPYDDPRYRDLYADPAPPPRPSARYADPRYDAPPYPPSYKDSPYLAPMPPPRRFTEGPDPRRPGVCLSRREIHERLIANGSGGFRDIDIRGEVAYVTAQRPSGRSFDLEVDRCTGAVLSARRLDSYERPYAWGGRYDDRRY